MAVMTENPSDRPEAVRRVIESHGGKLIQFYWVFGDADVIYIYETPDRENAMSILLSLSSRGAIKSQETTVLISNDEAMRAMERAGAVDTGYRTPKQE